MSDNFSFDLTGIDLELALEVAFSNRSKLTHWGVQTAVKPVPPTHCTGCKTSSGGIKGRPERLVLFWTDPETTMFPQFAKLPAPLDATGALTIVRSWLDIATYGREPDHDGSNGKGWRVYNEAWGHVAGCWQAFAAIEPVWLMYGK